MRLNREILWKALYWTGVTGFVVSWLAAGFFWLTGRSPAQAIAAAALATVFIGVARRRRF